MTPRYPGAVWLPTGDDGPMERGAPDAGSMHEAVTRSKSVFGWVQSAHSCHGFNSQNGYMEQYMDFDRHAEGVTDGNSHVLTIESFDGLLIHNDPNYWEEGLGGIYGDSANTGRWDAGQCERWSDLIAWCAANLGIQLVQSNRAGDPGWGPHRLGVDPWRTDDYGSGEVWTHHPGKPCPGDLRIAQIPGIVARAQVIADAIKAGKCTYLPTGEVDLTAAKARTGGITGGGITTPTIPTPFDPIGFLMSLPGAPATWAAAKAEIVQAITDAMAAPFPTDGSQTLGTATQAVVNNVHAQGSIINPKTGARKDFGHMNIALGLVAEKVGVQPA